MVEPVEALHYTHGNYDENPFRFTMVLHHSTPVRIDTPEAQAALLAIIRQTLVILREANPWAMDS